MYKLVGLLTLIIVLPPSGKTSASPHEQAVGALIRQDLNLGFAARGKIDVATRIQLAFNEALSQRKERSTDEDLRDAEYYLIGLYGGTSRTWNDVADPALIPAYNAAKWVAHRCKDAGYPALEKWARTDPENPTSEPGGSMWAYRGIIDGLLQDGEKIVPEGPGHGLNLPALNNAAACETSP